ncbi:hypothetical protein [Streptomyces colonosanans]|nr:hypothetical protein [Streptomyces colonosanans]
MVPNSHRAYVVLARAGECFDPRSTALEEDCLDSSIGRVSTSRRTAQVE